MDVQSMDWLQAMDVAVVVHDPVGRIVFSNQHAQDLLGVPSSQLIGMTALDDQWSAIDVDGRTVPGDQHPVMQVLATGQAARDVVLGVVRGERPERIWLLISAQPIRDAQGTLQQVVVTFTDVTVAQRALQQSEATYRSVIRAMSEGVVLHNADGSIRECNASAEVVLGMSLEQMTGRSPLDPRWRLEKPDGTPIANHEIPSEITRVTGQPCQNVLLGVHRPNGERAWLSVSTDPLRNPADETLEGVVATFADVTAEREVRLELESSRANLKRVLDALPGVVFQVEVTETNTIHVPFVGGRIHELLGVTQERLQAEPELMRSVIDQEERTRMLQSLLTTRALEGQNAAPFDREFMITRPSGETRWVRAHVVPSDAGAGQLYTGVLLDVTEAHALADGLRTTQRREVLGDLAAGVAHNFNNLLAVILPNVELAAAQTVDETRELLDEAGVAARNAADLVRQMLAFGRRGTFTDMAADSVDLVPLVREAVGMCRRTFDRAIMVDASIDVPHAFVRGTAGPVQQVLLNLLLNARDAVQGRVEPRVTARLYVNDGYVTFEVHDNGVGMNDDVRRRVGEPFFTTKGAGRGTGLGLASAFATIRESHGRWIVESTVDVGSTIRVDLPAVDGPVPAQTTPLQPHNALPVLRILVVDDEPLVRKAITRQLRMVGAVVDEAPDGASALAHLAEISEGRAPRIDLLILDLSMPGLGGRAVLERVVHNWPELPVMIVTGDPGETALPGAWAVLQKPVRLEQLTAQLQQLAR